MTTDQRAGEIDMDLTVAEARALARRIVARHLKYGDWVTWEDFPNLTELAIVHVIEEVEALGQKASAHADARDRAEDIDSMDLLMRAGR
jgi:hypothetical protein